MSAGVLFKASNLFSFGLKPYWLLSHFLSAEFGQLGQYEECDLVRYRRFDACWLRFD
jgi:hypothetical protein